jgi:NTP pyrophosphatase (non-canonical NTP hydrolase)
MTMPYCIGSDRWNGISKILEETSELNTVCAKIIGNEGNTHYWEGIDLRACLHEELADTMAAIIFFVDMNNLDTKTIDKRLMEKLDLYYKWDEDTRAAAA